jgi:hypothetical protein
MKNNNNNNMENLENEIAITNTNENFVLTESTPVLTEREAAIIARSVNLNLPALCSFFEENEDYIKSVLAKAPEQPCNC